MALLIVSGEHDTEASRVAWGLRERGIQVIHWEGLGQSHPAASVWLNGKDEVFLDEHKVQPQDTLWLRTPPALDYTAFERSLLISLERTGAFCINKWSAGRMIEPIAFQRSLAKQCGLRVPATLISVVTPLMPDFVPRAEFGFSFSQARIQKASDVRINMLLRDFHAFKVALLNEKIQCAERIDLPVQTESRLRRFAEHADLAFGFFEMAIDTDGEWWFLAVHPSGPSLWIDEIKPEEGLYTAMLEFLSAREGSSNLTFPSFRLCLSACPESKLLPTPLS